MTEFYIPLNTK